MKSALKLLSTGLVVLLGSGCAMAPHPVEPYVNRTQEIDVADDTLVSIGNYELMESLTARLKKNDYGLEIADRIVFRDTAFPNGGWQLNELLTPENCARTISETGVTHMALIGPAAIEEEEIEGYYFPLVIGGMKADQKLTLAAVIYDLRSQDIVCRIESSAEGSSLIAIYIIIAVGTWPLTESAALNGLADEIALAISEDMNGEPTKIVLMGAESPTDDTPLTADVEAEEFFPFPGYDSTLTAGLSRDEIRARLGTPYLFSNKLQLDIFLSAVFAENLALSYLLGMCTFLAVSRRVSTAFGLGLAVIVVEAVTVPLNNLAFTHLLTPGALEWAGLGEVDLRFLKLIMLLE